MFVFQDHRAARFPKLHPLVQLRPPRGRLRAPCCVTHSRVRCHPSGREQLKPAIDDLASKAEPTAKDVTSNYIRPAGDAISDKAVPVTKQFAKEQFEPAVKQVRSQAPCVLHLPLAWPFVQGAAIWGLYDRPCPAAGLCCGSMPDLLEDELQWLL